MQHSGNSVRDSFEARARRIEEHIHYFLQNCVICWHHAPALNFTDLNFVTVTFIKLRMGFVLFLICLDLGFVLPVLSLWKRIDTL